MKTSCRDLEGESGFQTAQSDDKDMYGSRRSIRPEQRRRDNDLRSKLTRNRHVLNINNNCKDFRKNGVLSMN